MGAHAAWSRSARTAVLLAALLGVARQLQTVDAQAAPPSLAPFRGLIDHQSVALNGAPSLGASINNVHALPYG